MPMFDLGSYAERAERFVSALDREYYLHFAGHKGRYEIEAIYDHNSGLFGHSVVAELRELLDGSSSGDQQRRLRYLLQLAVDGTVGHATRRQGAALAEREGSLEVRVNEHSESYRQTAITQANEPDPELRAAIERSRLDALARELNPLHVEIVEVAHALAQELGWRSYRAMYEDLKAVDLEALERQTHAFSVATGSGYREQLEPQLREHTGIGFDQLRRSDLPFFFRADAYDGLFPASRLVPAFERTLAGLGIELREQTNVKLDLEQRPGKSPRAFCASVQVPQEIYLVIPRKGGRDDYAALFHEGGHTEHYASVDPDLPFEFRHLGDNSVTEGFAFLFEHLTEDPEWLRLVLGARDAQDYLAYVRASKMLFLRRYAAKLSYELELHGGTRPLTEMPDLYGRRMSEAVGVEWPAVSYLADVDEGYYVASYLRAWAFEARLRQMLRERFGEQWFARSEAGEFLRSLWRDGQRLGPEELLSRSGAGELDFEVMLDEVRAPDQADA
jgi:hypothetical protein